MNIENVKTDLTTTRENVDSMPTMQHRDNWSEVYIAAMGLNEALREALGYYNKIRRDLDTARSQNDQMATRSQTVRSDLTRIAGNTTNPKAEAMVQSADGLMDKLDDYGRIGASVSASIAGMEILAGLAENSAQALNAAEAVVGNDGTVISHQFDLSNNITAYRDSL